MKNVAKFESYEETIEIFWVHSVNTFSVNEMIKYEITDGDFKRYLGETITPPTMGFSSE